MFKAIFVRSADTRLFDRQIPGSGLISCRGRSVKEWFATESILFSIFIRLVDVFSMFSPDLSQH